MTAYADNLSMHVFGKRWISTTFESFCRDCILLGTQRRFRDEVEKSTGLGHTAFDFMIKVAVVFNCLHHVGSNKMAKRTPGRWVSVRCAAAVLSVSTSAELGIILVLPNVIVKENRHHLTNESQK